MVDRRLACGTGKPCKITANQPEGKVFRRFFGACEGRRCLVRAGCPDFYMGCKCDLHWVRIFLDWVQEKLSPANL